VAILRFPNLGPSVFLVFFYYNLVKHGLFAIKFCTHIVTDNVNKCTKFSYCMISTFSCVYILWLNRMLVCKV